MFNFWEPVHYLLHGYGLQTWELSPQYSIRSWLYIALHAAPLKLVSFIPAIGNSKVMQFYALRSILGGVAVVSEGKLFESMWYEDGKRRPLRSYAYLWFAATSTGNFISSSSLLPNSFAMYCVSFALASFLNQRPDTNDCGHFLWLAVGTILGWPFVGALSLPFAVYEVALASRMGDSWRIFVARMKRTAYYSLAILVSSLPSPVEFLN